MKRFLITLAWICISWTVISSQVSYLERPDLLEKTEICLQHTYGFSFSEARGIQDELSRITPNHPIPVFLEGLIIYWENFPLVPSSKASKQFVRLMDRTTELARECVENEQTYIEGIFFDLFGRAFKAMYWADNGKSGKIVGDLGIMYQQTKEGFELQDLFVEFYFSSGLYNYYIEAYPEAHPIYKPLLSFMHKGDRDQGLKQLNYAINHAVFVKAEARLFMSIIQLNYEKDLNTAALYAERLVNDYPNNIFYQGHLVHILLHQHRYEKVRELLAATAGQKDDYSKMIRTLALAYMAEHKSGSLDQAEAAYQESIALAGTFGPFADIFQAMGYMGLSRLYERKGLFQDSKRYARKASKLTSYSFILEE